MFICLNTMYIYLQKPQAFEWFLFVWSYMSITLICKRHFLQKSKIPKEAISLCIPFEIKTKLLKFLEFTLFFLK